MVRTSVSCLDRERKRTSDIPKFHFEMISVRIGELTNVIWNLELQ
ncbi:hypothetical protein ALC57_02340 [Trachymyrmex cornetzi]|uniref:Uncharacterized protein n=1 Tax=Trachymyrmex cornetzi TaxID=471704 RepID=A0A195EK90_9HYME|nr:hypothetical protein ALC57_02340 [Trachymyrmex cornetzi]